VTPRFANSYHLGSVGIVDGSISYLYSSIPLGAHLTPGTDALHLPALCRAYHGLNALPRREPLAALTPTTSWADSPTMLYGRLYLPQSRLEALLVRRFSPGLQFQLRAVSSDVLKDGGSVLGLAQYDVGKYSAEGLASSDGGLLGLRGVYNFGGDASGEAPAASAPSATVDGGNGSNGSDKERIYGRFTAGGEIYYGIINKSGGMSCGLRFATLPSHNGTPLTATVTLNPLVGSIAATYAIKAGKFLSLGSRLDFNVYSYDSNWSVGMELWRKEVLPRIEEPVVDEAPKKRERSFQAKLEWRLDDPEPDAKSEPGEAKESGKQDDGFGSMIKARFDQNSRVGLLWEGRVESLLFSIGTNMDMRRLDHPFRTLGLEIQYSS
jgi:mitochondrial distribution and morphology protein 10